MYYEPDPTYLGSMTIPLPGKEVIQHLKRFAQSQGYRFSDYDSGTGVFDFECLIEAAIPLGIVGMMRGEEPRDNPYFENTKIGYYAIEYNPWEATDLFQTIMTNWHKAITHERHQQLLKLLEPISTKPDNGPEKTNTWQPLPTLPPSELLPLLQPITLNWRISQLIRWVEDFRSDTNGTIMLFHSQAKGSIDIYASPFTLVGMLCERPVNGRIELTPYILEGATPSAIAELQKWRDALGEAKAERQRLAATADIVPVEDMPRTVGKPAENPERRKKKDTIRKLVMEGHTLRYIADNNIDIPYSTARLLRNELIEEGQLPQEVKKTRKKLGPNSI